VGARSPTPARRLKPRSRPPAAALSGVVPTICRFFGIVIAMYYDDHGHPHFHARHADGQAKVRIDRVDVIDSSLDVRQYGSCWRGPSFTAPS
jgi:hypothetical protein